MKKEIIILTFLVLIISPTILAETIPSTIKEIKIPEQPITDAWNETIIISPVWQQLIGTLFGLNLKEVSTKISVRESLVFFSILIMFLIIIFDILKLTPFFKIKILNIISGEFIAALIITILVSISGAFINLKNLFLQAVTYTIMKLNWDWINTAIGHRTFSSILTGMLVIIIFLVIWQIFDFLEPIIKRYSQISRAQAKGRLLNTVIEESNTQF
jgi:hypothetical protein